MGLPAIGKFKAASPFDGGGGCAHEHRRGGCKVRRASENHSLIRGCRARSTSRTASGYREFEQLHVLAFVEQARSLGFSIDDRCTLTALEHDRSRASHEVKAVAEAQLGRILTKIAESEAMRATLNEVLARCPGDHCPISPIMNDLTQDG